MKKSKLFLILLIVAILMLIVMLLVLMNLGIIPVTKKNNNNLQGNIKENKSKIDDWCYEYKNEYDSYITSSQGFDSSIKTQMGGLNFSVAESKNIGYSVGGAKDISNFRENIEQGYFPLNSDITYEGIFYDYSFDTGNTDVADSSKLFYPTYATAVSKDPISENEEYYVSVGLNSNIKENDFKRKKLNLVLVLDISGSMSSSIDEYYYDMSEKNDEEFKTKMQVANESVNVLLDQLNSEDSVGIVLFDDNGYLAKPLNLVGDTDISAIKEHVLEIKAMGGTNFEEGIKLANETFEEYGIKDTNEYENRMIIITDAMPNIGETSKEGLKKLLENNSQKGIYTSFIGVGVDFNSEVVKNITDVKGANYYSVSSEEEFKTRMGEEFEFMVTPLVFDLSMDIISEGYEVEKIYGTDSINSEKGNILHINTLFPSKTNSEGEVKGGIILLKLKKVKDNAKDFTIKVSYETRDGNKDYEETVVEFSSDQEYYDNTGIRKGILLSRYTNLIKDWTEYERTKDDRYLITPIIGIIDYPNFENETIKYNEYYSENERVSVKLSISEKYKEIFSNFKEYLKTEINQIKDDSLNQEVEILEKILMF